jgi:hypothetical protein
MKSLILIYKIFKYAQNNNSIITITRERVIINYIKNI